jgi:hypothetical protein
MKATRHGHSDNRKATPMKSKHFFFASLRDLCGFAVNFVIKPSPKLVIKQTPALALTFVACAVSCFAQSFYTQPHLFSTAPDEKKSMSTIARFGPVGMAIELHQPAFTMIAGKIEDGSPAAAAGLIAGQIIESINGEKLKDIDPRIQLGRIIEKAEAADGSLKFLIREKPEAAAREVIVKIPALGSYSKTWPLNCPKSDKIVRNYADYLKKPGSNKGMADIGMLFLLSTGDESDLATVRDWARKVKGDGSTPWNIGYGGLALCEYYLRTGDKEVLPAIQARATKAIEMETFGGWAGRGPMAAVTYGGGGGHLNAGGTLVAAYLMLAKECGAEISDEPFQRILAHFYRWVGKGNNPYGNNKPEGGYTDNGKNGKLAFVMAAAASLTPDGEKSIYARARDTNSRFAFYSTSYMLHGHTGGGIGEIWRSASMGLLHEKQPVLYRDFMDQRKWHYEMSRRFDGSFGILGGERYDDPLWGAGYALTYTVPRKTLRLTGAPPSKFSKHYQLPERPWGTKADDDFVNTEPPVMPDGSKLDFSKETLANDASMAMQKKIGAGSSDANLIRRYLHHPDYMVRATASRSLKMLEPSVLAECLASTDARVRRTALEGIIGDTDGKLLTQENFDRVIAMLKDPQESWFVKDAALGVVSRAPADWTVLHVDAILPFLKHEEWWLQNSALGALAPVAGDLRVYQKVVPAIGELARTTQIYNVTSPLRWGKLAENLAASPPEVQKLVSSELKEAYIGYVPIETRSIPALATANDMNRAVLATSLANVEGGYDLLFQIAKQRDPDNPLPYQEIFLNADQEKFSPELKKAVATVVETQLIPGHIGSGRRVLLNEVASLPPQSTTPKLDGLVELYQKIGITDYDWHDFGPAPASMSWQYHTFDPPEKLAWDSEKARYRKVTLPSGMESWFSNNFDPSKAGWKSGKQPIGQLDGKLGGGRGCKVDVCRCADPVQTFWENEVLLAKGSFKFPTFREGYRYRLVVGGMSHVGAGEGFRIYANGKQLIERNRGVGKREGGKHVGMIIEKSFWPEFQKGDVSLAFITFKNIHKGASNNHFSIWIQEMKVPPVGEREIIHSASVTPMLSSEWQAKQDPDNLELQTSDDMFRYDGKFISNPKLLGKWTIVSQTSEVDAFDPATPAKVSRPIIQELTFKDGGRTDQLMWLWSGDTLMDLERNQALKMTLKNISGSDYLFVEAGGFTPKNKPGWKTGWLVLKSNNLR